MEILQIIGVITCAITGASEAVKYRLDYFGVFVLGLFTALGGGFMRDIILGHIPPVMFTAYRYSLAAICSVSVFIIMLSLLHNKLKKHEITLDYISQIFDALGLGAFCIVGTESAMLLDADNVWMACFVGTLTGVGGGVVRDILLSRVPNVLKKDIYAIIGIFGTLLFFFLSKAAPKVFAEYFCVCIIVVIRLYVIYKKPQFPKFRE